MNKLLSLARSAIECSLDNKKLVIPEEIEKKYSEKKACFVTLTKNGNLRGCIGSLYPRQVLHQDIVENAIHAAFDDSRFPPLKKSELPDIKIEISILNIPRKLNFKNEKEFLGKINNKMGIILRKDFYSSTFLPQVWEQISDKKKFLEELSMKAGLNKDAWKNAEIWYYYANIEKEY